MNSRSMRTPLPHAAARQTPASVAVTCSTLDAPTITEEGGLWARSSPEAISRAALDIFGADAVQAIEWCALSASNARRESDLRFWLAVQTLLDPPAPDGKQ